jgi:hypothetical protein
MDTNLINDLQRTNGFSVCNGAGGRSSNLLMKPDTPVAMVRCRLDASQDNSALRYVPAAEFDLWRHLMESKYARAVAIEDCSVWVPEKAALWDDGIDTDQLKAVVRVRFEKPGPQSTVVPVIRYLPNKTYPEAKAALLAHFDLRCRWSLVATPGYFVSTAASVSGTDEESLDESARPNPGWTWFPDAAIA